jgi:hypothetical protein
MSETVQTLLVGLIVAVAALYVGRRAWATLRPKRDAGCAAGCGCGDAAADGAKSDWAQT